MKRRFVTVSVLAALTMLAGCASSGSAVRVDKADTDLTKCRSFDWLQPSKELATLTDQRVRVAALAELEKKGYTIVTENPDCKISYVLSTYERPQQKPRVGVGATGGSRGVGGGIGVSLPIGRGDRFGGTLTLDIVDVATNAQIWSGSLDGSTSSTELSEEEAQAAVRRILREFPDRRAG